MDVVTLSPVLAARVVWRRALEHWALTLVVKATFDLLQGEVRPSSQPLPLSATDVHDAGNPARSLLVISDLVPFKARADVLLVGHAYAPHGRPVSALTARLAVGGVDKSIAVFGNRVVSAHGVGPALPFAKMSLSYERASGGPGTSNPPGLPRGADLPNLEPPGWSAAPRPDFPPKVGFGPIAPAWPERAAKHRAWRWDEPIPEDFDPSYFNAAPPDQQAAFLRGDETIVLESLHPDHPTLVTRLLGLVPRVFFDREDAAPTLIEMRADTVWIDTDRRKVSVVWRGDTAIAAPDEPGHVLVVMTNAREPIGWEKVQELYSALSASGAHGAATIDDEETGADGEDEMLRTNAVPAARLSGDGQDDDDEEDAIAAPSGADPLGTSTRAAPAFGGAAIPGAPAWLVASSRPAAQAAPPPVRNSALPFDVGASARSERSASSSSSAPLEPVRAFETDPSASAARRALPNEGPPPLDLIWEGPVDGREPPPLAPRDLASAPDAHAPHMNESSPLPQRTEARTGPLPVLTTPEPQSPWATGLEPGMLSPSAPVAAAAPVMARPEPPPAEAPRPARTYYRAPAEAVDLIWFDPDAVARIGARFREIVDELDMEPLDPAHDVPVDDPLAARDRHHVFGVLTRAPITDARGVTAAVREATDPHGRFTPPLVVVEGELVFGLDDQRVLKMTAASAKPLAKDNPRLQIVLASVEELLETPFLQGMASSDGVYRELLAAVSQSKRAVPAKVLEEHVERLLLSQRAYQIRSVLGGPQIRAVLAPVRDALALTAYLPEAIGPRLPLSLRFRARLIAEVHPSPDPQEAAPLSLRAAALGRLVPLPGR